MPGRGSRSLGIPVPRNVNARRAWQHPKPRPTEPSKHAATVYLFRLLVICKVSAIGTTRYGIATGDKHLLAAQIADNVARVFRPLTTLKHHRASSFDRPWRHSDRTTAATGWLSGKVPSRQSELMNAPNAAPNFTLRPRCDVSLPHAIDPTDRSDQSDQSDLLGRWLGPHGVRDFPKLNVICLIFGRSNAAPSSFACGRNAAYPHGVILLRSRRFEGGFGMGPQQKAMGPHQPGSTRTPAGGTLKRASAWGWSLISSTTCI